MSESISLALVVSGSAILSSLVTGWFTYIAAGKKREIERYKHKLKQANTDIVSFHRLEERYTHALQSGQKTALAWKREIRKQQRDAGLATPSEHATAKQSEEQIVSLS